MAAKTMKITLNNTFTQPISWFFEESVQNMTGALPRSNPIIDLGQSTADVDGAHNYRIDVAPQSIAFYTVKQGNNNQGKDRGYAMWFGFDCNKFDVTAPDAKCGSESYTPPALNAGKCYPNDKFNPPNGCEFGGLKGAQGHIVEYNVGLPGESLWFDLSAVDGAANYKISVDALCMTTSGTQECCEGNKSSSLKDLKVCSQQNCMPSCAFPMLKCPAQSQIGKTIEFDGMALKYCMSPMQTCNCGLTNAKNTELKQNRPCGVGSVGTCGGKCSLDGLLQITHDDTTSRLFIKVAIGIGSVLLLIALTYAKFSNRIGTKVAIACALVVLIACITSLVMIPSSTTYEATEVDRKEFKMDAACGCTGCNSAMDSNHGDCAQYRTDKFCQSQDVSNTPDGWKMPVVQKTKYAQAIDSDCKRTYAYPYGDVGKLSLCRHTDKSWELKVTVGPA